MFTNWFVISRSMSKCFEITFIHVLLTTGRCSVLKSTGHATVSVLWLRIIDFPLYECIMQARLPNQF